MDTEIKEDYKTAFDNASEKVKIKEYISTEK